MSSDGAGLATAALVAVLRLSHHDHFHWLELRLCHHLVLFKVPQVAACCLVLGAWCLVHCPGQAVH